MRATLRWEAAPDTRFAHDAFERSVGKQFASNGAEGTLIGYEVIEDGRAVLLDVELPFTLPEQSFDGFSFRLDDEP